MTYIARDIMGRVYAAQQVAQPIVNTSYVQSYPALVAHFAATSVFTEEAVVVAAHLVYAWMPTILEIDFALLPEVLPLLEAARKGTLLSSPHLSLLANVVNHSAVGASKLLHFINPTLYPIWDRKIYRFLHPDRQGHHYQLNEPGVYEAYAAMCRDVAFSTDFQLTYQQIIAQFRLLSAYQHFTITPIRALEHAMFTSTNSLKSSGAVTAT